MIISQLLVIIFFAFPVPVPVINRLKPARGRGGSPEGILPWLTVTPFRRRSVELAIEVPGTRLRQIELKRHGRVCTELGPMIS